MRRPGAPFLPRSSPTSSHRHAANLFFLALPPPILSSDGVVILNCVSSPPGASRCGSEGPPSMPATAPNRAKPASSLSWTASLRICDGRCEAPLERAASLSLRRCARPHRSSGVSAPASMASTSPSVSRGLLSDARAVPSRLHGCCRTGCFRAALSPCRGLHHCLCVCRPDLLDSYCWSCPWPHVVCVHAHEAPPCYYFGLFAMCQLADVVCC